jgi:signal transduction histidine kinase
MTDDTAERFRKLRHDIANPLAALLAEAQLLLHIPGKLDPELTSSIKEIERLALRMRDILRNT